MFLSSSSETKGSEYLLTSKNKREKIDEFSINIISQFGVAFNCMMGGASLACCIICAIQHNMVLIDTTSANRKCNSTVLIINSERWNERMTSSSFMTTGFIHDTADVLLKQHISVRQSNLMSSITQHDAAGHKLLSRDSQRKVTQLLQDQLNR